MALSDNSTRQSALSGAKDKALRLLCARAYTSQGLYLRLEALYGHEAASAAVDRMLELELLNDEDYARRFAQDAIIRRRFSLSRVARELASKGVDPEITESVLCEFEEEEEYDPKEAIARVLKKKYLSVLDDEKGRRRAFNALIRLGYRCDDIRAVIKMLREDEEYYDE